MYPLAIISDSVDDARQLSSQLAGIFAAQVLRRSSVPGVRPVKYAIVDINLTDHTDFPDLRTWLKRQPQDRITLFAVENGNRYQATQAYALGATDVVPRPIDGKLLFKKLLGETDTLVGDAPTFSTEGSPGISAAVDALQTVFASACSGASLDQETLNTAGETVVSRIEADGCVQWIDTVRKHHSQTYQHCLLVTGVAAVFGQHLGFASKDRQKLVVAGLVHDIGKARIPVAILEKPGPLDADEMAAMRQHARIGFDALRDARGVEPEMLDMVLHHHEYLDGSGYPDGLRASDISDFVRIMTISDIFGALIERRAYKAPMSGEAAYQILQKMGGKLDSDLLREFEPIARVQIG